MLRTLGHDLRIKKLGDHSRNALFLGHLGLGDQIWLVGAVRYLSINYDKFYIPCLPHNLKTLTELYLDNPKIKVFTLAMFYHRYHYTVSPTDTVRGECMDIPKGFYKTVFRSGLFALPRNDLNDIPNSFYRDLNLDPSIRHTYFYIPKSPRSILLYSFLNDMSYIFVQTKSSNTTTPIITWDINKILTIDPNVNQYSSDHAWYTLAENFVNQPFLHYSDTIKHATELHLVNSSFYTLASQLRPLHATVKVCYDRETGNVIPNYDFS
jgi:hypothetical protein